MHMATCGTEGTGIEGTGIVHVTGRTEGTGMVYTAMGQGTRLCTQLRDRGNRDRGNWDCVCRYGTEGNWIVHVTMGQRKIGLCSQLISYGTRGK